MVITLVMGGVGILVALDYFQPLQQRLESLTTDAVSVQRKKHENSTFAVVEMPDETLQLMVESPSTRHMNDENRKKFSSE